MVDSVLEMTPNSKPQSANLRTQVLNPNTNNPNPRTPNEYYTAEVWGIPRENLPPAVEAQLLDAPRRNYLVFRVERLYMGSKCESKQRPEDNFPKAVTTRPRQEQINGDDCMWDPKHPKPYT